MVFEFLILFAAFLNLNEDSFYFLKTKAYANANEPDSVILFAKKGKERALLNRQIDSAGYYYYLFTNEIADAYKSKGNLREAIKHYEGGIQYRKTFGDKVSLAYIFKGYGQVLESQGRYIDAIGAFEEAKRIFTSFNDVNLPGISIDLGVSYMQLFKYEKAYELFDIALNQIENYFDTSQNRSQHITHLLYVNKIYAKVNLAITIAEKSINQDIPRVALVHINQALEIVETPEFSEEEKIYYSNLLKINEAYIYYKTRQRAEMEQVLLNDLKLPVDKDLEYYFVIGCYHKIFGRSEEAFENFKKTFTYSDSLNKFRPAFTASEEISKIITRVSSINDSAKNYYSDMNSLYKDRMTRINVSLDSLMEEERRRGANNSAIADDPPEERFSNSELIVGLVVIILSSVSIVALYKFFGQKSKCKRFYDAESRTIDLTGLSAGVSQKLNLGVGSLKIDSRFQKASEDIQKLDMLQYTICRDINGIDDKKLRQEQLIKIIETKSKMMEIIFGITHDANSKVGSKK